MACRLRSPADVMAFGLESIGDGLGTLTSVVQLHHSLDRLGQVPSAGGGRERGGVEELGVEVVEVDRCQFLQCDSAEMWQDV